MTTFEDVIKTAQAIQKKIDGALGPPEDGRESKRQEIVYKSLVKGTRGYIEKIANQANGAYEQGWYDATAVMIRRLLETLIIECFEKHKLDSKIKNSQGDFFFERFGGCLSL